MKSTNLNETKHEIIKLAENHIVPEYIKILCIDDNPNDPELLLAVLSKSKKVHYKTETASTYNDGLTLITQQKHDIYLIDIKLDGANDGLDLIEECIKKGIDGPFVIWSGYIDERVYQRNLTANLNFLSKNEQNIYILDNLIRYTIKNWKLSSKVREYFC